MDSLKKFGEKIAIGQMRVSYLESERRKITPRLIKDICSTFKANEEWHIFHFSMKTDVCIKTTINFIFLLK